MQFPLRKQSNSNDKSVLACIWMNFCSLLQQFLHVCITTNVQLSNGDAFLSSGGRKILRAAPSYIQRGAIWLICAYKPLQILCKFGPWFLHSRTESSMVAWESGSRREAKCSGHWWRGRLSWIACSAWTRCHLTLKTLLRAQLCNSPTCRNIKSAHFSFCKMQVNSSYYCVVAVKATSIWRATQCVCVRYVGKILTLCKTAASP